MVRGSVCDSNNNQKSFTFYLHQKKTKAKYYAGTLKSLLAVAEVGENVNTDAGMCSTQRNVEAIVAKK